MRMMGKSGIVCPLSLTLLFLWGCEQQPTEVEHYAPQPILSAFLVCGEPIQEVFLERVSSLYKPYDFSQSGIRGAQIVITGMGSRLRLVDDPLQPGRYIPAPGEELIPQPKGYYSIEARTPQGEILTASATVPDTFSAQLLYLLYPDGNRVPVHDGDTLHRLLPTLWWEWAPVDSAGGYILLAQALSHPDSLLPLDPDFDPSTDSLPDEMKDRSAWWIMRDDQSRVTIPWIFFQFAGPYRLTLMAANRDYYLYTLTTMQAQFGYLRFPHTNIRGGLGIFGAISKASYQVFLKRVELPG